MKRSLVSLLTVPILLVAAPLLAQPLETEDEQDAQDSGVLPRTAPHRPSNTPNGLTGAIPEDRIETSQAVPPGIVEVTTLNPQGIPLPQVAVEILPVRTSGLGNPKGSQQRALSDDHGQVRFANIPTNPDSTYRVFTIIDGVRSGTSPFVIETKGGTKISLHVYPVIRDLNQALVLGKSFWFVEPREGAIYLEMMTEFYNLGTSTWVPDGIDLPLPSGFTAFTTNEVDPNLSAKATDRGIRLEGALGPGRHALTFSFELPRNNEPNFDVTLPLWPRMAEVRVATVARPGIDLSVEGYPETQLAESNGQAPLRITGRAYAKEVAKAPEDLHVTLRGLPITGKGRLVAAALAGLLAVLALLGCRTTKASRQENGNLENAGEREALDRLLDELADLARAHRKGLVGNETFEETQQALVAACIRLERRIASRCN